MNVQDFLNYFPEFNDLNVFPQATIQVWLDVSLNLVSPRAWGSSYNLGVSLLTAHNLWIGQSKGEVQKILDTKSIDSVSGHYNVDLTTYKDAGYFNQSEYGIRYYQLMKMFGAGVIGVI